MLEETNNKLNMYKAHTQTLIKVNISQDSKKGIKHLRDFCGNKVTIKDFFCSQCCANV